MLKFVALSSLAGLLVVWIAYPLVIGALAWLVAHRRRSSTRSALAYEPSVSVIIATRDDPDTIKRRIDNFELVINSRWPTVQDLYLSRWSRIALQTLSSWRYALGFYAVPVELAWAQKLVALRKPRWESL